MADCLLQTGCHQLQCQQNNWQQFRSAITATLMMEAWHQVCLLSSFFKSIWPTHVLYWGHWYPCFGFLVTSPLGFKARVGSALFALQRQMYCTFPEIHLWYCCISTSLCRSGRVRCLSFSSTQCSWSFPYINQQRWDLARI